MTLSSPIVDFHCHFMPKGFELTTLDTNPASQRARWAITNTRISDEAVLMADIDSGDLAMRVVNAPMAHICDLDGNVPFDTVRRLNDALGDLVTRSGGRIAALATVDAYGDSERAALELERAVTTLGLRGVFVDCARGAEMIDAPRVRPVLETAARLGVPVFVHPINPEPMHRQMEPYGRIGTLFARGTINAQALIALVEGGTFEALPGLKVVVTALAFGGVAALGGLAHFSRIEGSVREILRQNVLIDTMEFCPTQIRASVELVGIDNVMVGSDWPIVSFGPIRDKVEAALQAAGLDEAGRVKVAGSNARRLLGIA